MAETTANAVANYIIHFCHERGDLITNLHLQKLVYYAQAWYLALHDKPLFEEELQAWASGPVQPELYERFKTFKWNPISEDTGKVDLPKHVEDHLLEVMDVYGKYNAFYLERMTQEEEPWVKARGGIPRDEHSTAVISKKDMQEFYKTLADGEEEDKAEAA
jgi:uncharacterized phage-associated protein